LWLLRRVLPADQVIEIEGDLAEVYASRYPNGGSLGEWWFWRQTGGFAIRYLPERFAERLGLTRARVTQICDLALLAPDIQATVLLGHVEPRDRHLREVGKHPLWTDQRRVFHQLFPNVSKEIDHDHD